MQAKNVLYAAVGAPVVAARRVSNQMNNLKGRFSEETANYTKVANKAIGEWASEGEKVVAGIREGRVVEEISQKVDFDQAKEQVSKLRDQLEDMLATWRQSFRPESAVKEKANAEEALPADETAARTSSVKKPATKVSTAKKPAAKTSTAKTTKSSSAKTGSAKSTAAKAKTSA